MYALQLGEASSKVQMLKAVRFYLSTLVLVKRCKTSK